jgi:hypothetical protein
MRVIVAGDRHWYAPDLAKQVVNRLLLRYGTGLVIVHGAATGIDSSFAEVCDDLGVAQEPHPARWKDLKAPGAVIRYDRRNHPYNANTGPERNAEMVAAGAEMCVAFHRFLAGSRGTKDCVRRANEAGIPTYLIDSVVPKIAGPAFVTPLVRLAAVRVRPLAQPAAPAISPPMISDWR